MHYLSTGLPDVHHNSYRAHMNLREIISVNSDNVQEFNRGQRGPFQMLLNSALMVNSEVFA